MDEPKSKIYTILSGIEGATTYQMRPRVVEDIPCFMYSVTGDTPVYSLDKEVEYQNIEVSIDIFAENSQTSGSLLATLVETMLTNNYRMTFCTDVSDDDYSHIATIFNLVGY